MALDKEPGELCVANGHFSAISGVFARGSLERTPIEMLPR